MKTYLVTGGAGFIGSHFVDTILASCDSKVINLDKLTYAGNMDNLSDVMNNNNHIFIKGDIGDSHLVSEIFIKYEIDIVVNFAAESHVDRSITNSAPFLHTNVIGTGVLLENAAKSWSNFNDKLFLQISTDEVYGSLDENVYAKENFPLRPGNPYAASKAAADLLVLSYANTYDLPVMISRSCNNFGPRQYPEKLIPLMISKLVSGESLPVYGDGEQKREWIYVGENCRMLLELIKTGKTGEIYNVGSDMICTNINLIKQLIGIYNSFIGEVASLDRIENVKDRKGHDIRYGLDSKKIKFLLKYTTTDNFDRLFKDTVEWFIGKFKESNGK